jgi:ribosome maturation factor RimP
MVDDPRLEAIRQVAQPLLAEKQVELVELALRRHGGQLVVRFLVDKVGGVTIQDCARLNQLIGEALDAADWMNDSYTLEVSSPGLDRPLISKRDFERAIGEAVEVELSEGVRGSRQIAGPLLAVQHEAIVVTTPSGNVTVPLTQIRQARKAIRF